ncbi:hypothetical protein DFH08DRAFT_432561 [Mycena albidolilacea]|uniref:Secreted protein n=1 Tax=Mycena albidolilacea TaxID=1033008 RepID=A0AAD7EDY1_9AGAR|nr:hypothetical protein DFH08DRAFT_432561 [Mycena albidolilacea]
MPSLDPESGRRLHLLLLPFLCIASPSHPTSPHVFPGPSTAHVRTATAHIPGESQGNVIGGPVLTSELFAASVLQPHSTFSAPRRIGIFPSVPGFLLLRRLFSSRATSRSSIAYTVTPTFRDRAQIRDTDGMQDELELAHVNAVRLLLHSFGKYAHILRRHCIPGRVATAFAQPTRHARSGVVPAGSHLPHRVTREMPREAKYKVR